MTSVFRLLLPLLIVCPALAQENYTIKTGDSAPPKELSESIQKLLGSKSVTLLEGGKEVAEFWFRSEIPTEADATQIKNGLTYKEITQTEILGAVRFPEDHRDYRKQKIKAGVYTLRLGYQPSDGDHMGSSDFQDFAVVLSAAKDTKAAPMEAKEMIDVSMKSLGTGHPGVFMLFPNSTAKGMPELLPKPKKHQVLSIREELVVSGKKSGNYLGIGLTVAGSAE